MRFQIKPVFESLRFPPSTTTTQRFRKSPFSKVSVFESLHFQTRFLNKRLRVDGRRKRTEKSPFSYENVYVWTWPKGGGTVDMTRAAMKNWFSLDVKAYSSSTSGFASQERFSCHRLSGLTGLARAWKKCSMFLGSWIGLFKCSSKVHKNACIIIRE